MTFPTYDLTTRQESATVDFKIKLDLSNRADACEAIKDIIAMANSG